MKNDLGLLLLAGGESRRMGRDKAGLELNGESFAQRIARRMGPFAERLLSSNDDMRLEGFVTLADEAELAGCGPAAGIATALAFCHSSYLMVVPCDAPMVDRQIAMDLWEAAKAEAGDGAADGGKICGKIFLAAGEKTAPEKTAPEPLIGLWPRSAEPKLRQELADGVFRLRDIIEKIGYETVATDGGKLLNVNRPADYEELIRTWKKATE